VAARAASIACPVAIDDTPGEMIVRADAAKGMEFLATVVADTAVES